MGIQDSGLGVDDCKLCISLPEVFAYWFVVGDEGICNPCNMTPIQYVPLFPTSPEPWAQSALLPYEHPVTLGIQGSWGSFLGWVFESFWVKGLGLRLRI